MSKEPERKRRRNLGFMGRALASCSSASAARQLFYLYRLARSLPALVNASNKLPRPEISPPSLPPSPFHHRSSSAWSLLTSRSFSYYSSTNEAKQGLIVDTLALVQKLETQGFDANQAQAITTAVTDALNDCLESVAEAFVSKLDVEESNETHDVALSKLQEDVHSSQASRIASIEHETEKLRTEIEKLRNEMRLQMDKVSAGQRLDLNLERGHVSKELEKESQETSKLTSKLDTEIGVLKKQLRDSKYEVIKHCIGAIVFVYAVGLALLRACK